MTTCDLSLSYLNRGRRDIAKFRYYGYQSEVVPDVSPSSFGSGGLDMLGTLFTWVNDLGLVLDVPAGLIYVVACRRKHLLEFWKRAYGKERPGSRQYESAEILRRKLEELNPRKLYALVAYEF